MNFVNLSSTSAPLISFDFFRRWSQYLAQISGVLQCSLVVWLMTAEKEISRVLIILDQRIRLFQTIFYLWKNSLYRVCLPWFFFHLTNLTLGVRFFAFQQLLLQSYLQTHVLVLQPAITLFYIQTICNYLWTKFNCSLPFCVSKLFLCSIFVCFSGL